MVQKLQRIKDQITTTEKGNKLYWIKKEDLCNKYVDTLENRWYTQYKK